MCALKITRRQLYCLDSVTSVVKQDPYMTPCDGVFPSYLTLNHYLVSTMDLSRSWITGFVKFSVSVEDRLNLYLSIPLF